MSPELIDVLEIIAVLGLILLNAFFVAAEFGLVSLRRTRIDELIARGNSTARIAKRVLDDPDRLIATTQLGITISSLGLGWIGEPALAHLLEPLFRFLPREMASPTTHAVAAGVIAFSVITFMHVVIGELTPKSIALNYPEQTALFVSRGAVLFENLFRPATWALSRVGNALLDVLGLNRPEGHQLVHSVEELKMLVEASTAGGELEPVEREMVHRAFEFADRTVVEVMTPRTDLVGLEENATVADFLKLFDEVSHSRFPVYRENLDDIVGFIWIKDVLRALGRDPAARHQSIRPLIRKVLFVPSTKRIGDLFSEMQQQNFQLAIVIDEYGGTAGMVTLEEVIEEIVGRVSDELTASPPPVRTIDEVQSEVEGQLRVDEVNAQLGLDLPESDDYETIAGLVLTRLGHIPKEGESVSVDDVELTVTAMSGPRIEKILVKRISRQVSAPDRSASTVDRPASMQETGGLPDGD